jgi:hypothetical protein
LQDETAGARFEQAVTEHREAGATVLRNLGVENVEAWERHVRATDPGLANKIVRDVWNKDMSSLIQSGKAYVQQRQASIVAKLEGHGVSSFTDHGTVFLNVAELERAAGISIPTVQGRGEFAGKRGSITLSEAIRLGYITLSE